MKYQQNYTQGVFVGMVCNAKCSFCNAQVKIIGEEDYFKFYSFDRIKEDIQSKVSKGANCIIYEGGDFSLHPEIFKILEFGQSLGIKQTFQTNGIKLSDMEFVKKLKKYGVNEMNFSIHAYEESVSDSIMGVKGGFKKTIKGVLNCNDLGINISNNFVLVKENLNQLEGMIFLLFKLGIKLFNITMYIPVDDMPEKFHEKFLINPIDAGIQISKMLQLYKKLIEISDKKLELSLKFHNIGRCIFNKEDYDYNFQFDLDRRKDNNSDYRFDTGFYKKEDCKKCIYNYNCTGFTQKYIKIFGDNFITPIY